MKHKSTTKLTQLSHMLCLKKKSHQLGFWHHAEQFPVHQ